MEIKSPSTSVLQDSPDIVFVGAGPVGLWTAIQTRVLTGKKICVLEKYQEYQRADIRLNIDASSLRGIPNDPGLKALTKQWGGKVVPIKEMEESLVKRANELGIVILRGHSAEPKKLLEQFPTAKIFVGSDGARSQVRKEIFGEQYQFNQTQQYIAQVQYVIKPKDMLRDDLVSSKKINTLIETYVKQKFAEHLIIQNTRPQSDGSAKVTLQIFIDKDTYEKMSDATFKNPYYFETDLKKVPEVLREALIKWWGAREEYNGEVISSEAGKSNKITVIALGSYAAKEVVKVDTKGTVWTLVGDAAAAFPFFRAINNGLLNGTKLAQCIQEAFKNQIRAGYKSYQKLLNEEDLKSPLSPFKSYNDYATKRARIEWIKAAAKSFLTDMSSSWIKISNMVPWQSVKLNDEQKELAYNRGAAVWHGLSGIVPLPPPPKESFLEKINSTKIAFTT